MRMTPTSHGRPQKVVDTTASGREGHTSHRAAAVSLLIFLFAFSILPTLSAQTQTAYEELCLRAYRAAELDSLAAAIDYLRIAIETEEENPRNAILYAKIGALQRRRQLYPEALDAYQTALELAPLATSIMMERASLNLELGRLEAARDDYSEVIRLENDNPKALFARAYIHMQLHDYRLARTDYRHFLRLNPFSYSGRLGLATLERRAGNPQDALAILDRMIVQSQDTEHETDAERAALYTVRAGVEMDLDMLDAALLDLEIALQKDGTQAEAYLIRGQIHLAQQKKTQAHDDFEQAIRLGIPREEMTDLLQQCR